jgi:hypothetical protein
VTNHQREALLADALTWSWSAIVARVLGAEATERWCLEKRAEQYEAAALLGCETAAKAAADDLVEAFMDDQLIRQRILEGNQ